MGQCYPFHKPSGVALATRIQPTHLSGRNPKYHANHFNIQTNLTNKNHLMVFFSIVDKNFVIVKNSKPHYKRPDSGNDENGISLSPRL